MKRRLRCFDSRPSYYFLIRVEMFACSHATDHTSPVSNTLTPPCDTVAPVGPGPSGSMPPLFLCPLLSNAPFILCPPVVCYVMFLVVLL